MGNDWSSDVYYNGEQVRSCSAVIARKGSILSLKGKTIEIDNVPGVGSRSVYLKFTDGNKA